MYSTCSVDVFIKLLRFALFHRKVYKDQRRDFFTAILFAYNSLVNILLHVDVTVVRSLELPVEDHVLSRRKTSDEHIVLRTHSYFGFAILLSVQANLAARRCYHSGQHLAATRNFMSLRIIDEII